MRCWGTGSHSQGDGKSHRSGESNYRFIIYSLTELSLQQEERTNQIIGLPSLHLFLQCLEPNCTGQLKACNICLISACDTRHKFNSANSLKYQNTTDGNQHLERRRYGMIFLGFFLHELQLNGYLLVLLPQCEHGSSVFLHTCFSKQR